MATSYFKCGVKFENVVSDGNLICSVLSKMTNKYIIFLHKYLNELKPNRLIYILPSKDVFLMVYFPKNALFGNRGFCLHWFYRSDGSSAGKIQKSKMPLHLKWHRGSFTPYIMMIPIWMNNYQIFDGYVVAKKYHLLL